MHSLILHPTTDVTAEEWEGIAVAIAELPGVARVETFDQQRADRALDIGRRKLHPPGLRAVPVHRKDVD
jgi:hypothetical protein